jgi:hypothetical protein
MFRLFKEEPSKMQRPPQKSLAQEMRDKAIETLRKGIENENNPLKERVGKSKALITLLKEKISLEGSTYLAAELKEIEDHTEKLEKDLVIQSDYLAKKRAA